MQKNLPLCLLFKQAFHLYYQSLCQYAFTLIKESHSCEDIVQDIFIHVWEKKQDIIGKKELRFYLFTAVRNSCLNFLQKNKKMIVTGLTDHEIANEAVEIYQEGRVTDFTVLVGEALERLPFKCREVFIMSRLCELTYRQIAVSQGISVKTVENQMGKALRIMRSFVREKQVLVSGLTMYFYAILLIA